MLNSTRCALVIAAAALIGTPRSAAAQCVPGFSDAAFGLDGVGFSGSKSTTDSYNSAVGSYATTHVNSGSSICTDSTASGAITLSPATSRSTATFATVPVETTRTVVSSNGTLQHRRARKLRTKC